MRVLLFPASYSPVLGGLQTAVQELAMGLLEKGHAVRVVTNQYPRNLASQDNIDSIAIHRRMLLSPQWSYIKRGRPDLLAASLYFYPSNLLWLDKLMREFQPDVINVHYPEHQIPYVLRARRYFSFRLVISLHGDDIEQLPFGPQRNLRRELLRSADAVTACSEYLMGHALAFENSIAGKAHVIPNGISAERFEDKSYHRHPRPYLFAYGRMVPAKGFDMLLKAFTHIAPAYPDVDLILAGEGPEQTNLEKLRAQSGVGGRIHFHGRATPQEVVRLLNGCSLAVIPSRREPFGIVALEALAANRPVLATRVGGLPEAARGASVNLVEPTVAGLVDGLRAALRPHAPAAQPLPSKVQLPSWSDVVEHFTGVYETASEHALKCRVIRPASVFS